MSIKRIYEKFLIWRGIIGYGKLFEDQPLRFVPTTFRPRLDQHGRVYMLLADEDSLSSQSVPLPVIER